MQSEEIPRVTYRVNIKNTEDKDVNGEYLYTENQIGEFKLFFYKHKKNEYILFKKKLSINSDHNNTMMWIIAKYKKSNTKSFQMLYYCPVNESKSTYFVSKAPWKCFNKSSQSIDIVLRWYCSDKLDTNTNGNIFDINVRKAILIDIYKFSQYHSWYKHLCSDGVYYILIPKMYGQIRGYRRENRKINQIRWHCAMQRSSKSLLRKTNKFIAEIVEQYPFKFNNFFGATSREENDIQIENALQCGYKIYDEMLDLFSKWKKNNDNVIQKIITIATNWIKNNYDQYQKIPQDILLIVVMYCDIGFPDAFEKKNYNITYINN